MTGVYTWFGSPQSAADKGDNVTQNRHAKSWDKSNHHPFTGTVCHCFWNCEWPHCK